jgi:serpin B
MPASAMREHGFVDVRAHFRHRSAIASIVCRANHFFPFRISLRNHATRKTAKRKRTSPDNVMTRLALLAAAFTIFTSLTQAASFDPAAKATNELGLDLYRKLASGEENVCLSPYSISCALAMTLAGADGETRTEMARVLHLDPQADGDPSFAALQKSLAEIGPKTTAIAEQSKKNGGPSEPITIAIANRLFAQRGYQFRAQFFARVKDNYAAEPETLDFKQDAAAATKRINDWVAQQTRDRIRNLIPQPLEAATRLVLANALYLKAPWANEFSAGATKPEPFHVRGKNALGVPTMQQRERLRYAKRDGFSAVALPYSGGDLQFVILIPEKIDGLREIEEKMTADVLAECAQMKESDVLLYLPKFKIEPPTIQLAQELQALGMKTAFDIPPGSANFDRMAPRRPNDYLAISEVFHKTFIALDEKGTEAAAATAVVMRELTAMREMTEPIEIRADRPFLYAIQHVPSGACLFIGRVTDPRS